MLQLYEPLSFVFLLRMEDTHWVKGLASCEAEREAPGPGGVHTQVNSMPVVCVRAPMGGVGCLRLE